VSPGEQRLSDGAFFRRKLGQARISLRKYDCVHTRPVVEALINSECLLGAGKVWIRGAERGIDPCDHAPVELAGWDCIRIEDRMPVGDRISHGDACVLSAGLLNSGCVAQFSLPDSMA
jgi:hypothetical protein